MKPNQKVLDIGSGWGYLAIEICSKFPAITIPPSNIVIAVNSEYQNNSTVLCDGDEVALIPPVSGG